MNCPSCNNFIESDALFCQYCGLRLKSKCLSCGNINILDSKYCKNCKNIILHNRDFLNLNAKIPLKLNTDLEPNVLGSKMDEIESNQKTFDSNLPNSNKLNILLISIVVAIVTFTLTFLFVDKNLNRTTKLNEEIQASTSVKPTLSIYDEIMQNNISKYIYSGSGYTNFVLLFGDSFTQVTTLEFSDRLYQLLPQALGRNTQFTASEIQIGCNSGGGLRLLLDGFLTYNPNITYNLDPVVEAVCNRMQIISG